MDRADESDRAQSQTLHSFVRDSAVKTGRRRERRKKGEKEDGKRDRLWGYAIMGTVKVSYRYGEGGGGYGVTRKQGFLIEAS